MATAGSYASGPGPMIYIWDPKGRVLETHPMPVGVDAPTNCTFGDPDQRTLYITTAGGHLCRVRNTGRRGWIIWPPVRSNMATSVSGRHQAVALLLGQCLLRHGCSLGLSATAVRMVSRRAQGFCWHSTDPTRYNGPFHACTGEIGAMARPPATTHLTMREETIMQRRSVVIMSLLLVGCAVFWHAYEASGQGSGGWITLFDGKTLDHWTRLGEANWTIVDGVVQADQKVGEGSAFLVSKNSYTDFQLRVEFWVDTTANSGVFIRCADPHQISSTTAYEVNIFDTRPDPTYGTGAIVNVAKVEPMPKAGGQWNTYEITAKGPQLTVVLNGTKTVDTQDSKFASGPIALQYGAGVVKFRNVEIRPL